jgi:hypothetical protein
VPSRRLHSGASKINPTKIALAAALALFAASPARSGDENVATGIATFIAYDAKCEHVPIAFQEMVVATIKTIPTKTFEAAMDKVAAFYNKAGPAKFCAINKPVIDKAMTGVTGVR